MDEKELKALWDKISGKIDTDLKAAVKADFEDAIKGYLKADQLQTSLESLKVDDMTIKDIIAAVTTQGNKINEIEAAKAKGEKQTLKGLLTKIFPDIKKAYESGGNFKFTIDKTAVSLTSITSDPMGMFVPGFARIASQQLTILPSLAQFPLGADTHGIIYWTDQTTRTNNAAARSDGSASAEQVYAWTGQSETVDNISAMIPVHEEALKHISIMENEIRGLLEDDIRVKAEDYAYTGTGTAPQIGGLYTRATAFSTATYVAAGGYTPVNADLYDLILAMSAQIMKGSKYIVDTAWVNPYTALLLKSAKDLNGRRDLPPMLTVDPSGNMRIGNIRIVESNSVTANTMVIGDSTKARCYFGDNIEIAVGYDLTGDFSKRIKTIRANMELSLLIRNAEADAFLKSTDVTGDITGLTKVTG